MAFGVAVDLPVETRLQDAPEEKQMWNLRGFPPFSTGTLPTAEMEPGAYGVAVHIASDILDQRSFVVLDDAAKAQFLGEIQKERLVRRTVFNEPFDVERCWMDAWEDVFKYLGTRPPEHVRWTVDRLEVEPARLRMLVPDALRWVAFHVGRFLFDQLFYGGDVRVRRNAAEREGLDFQLTVRSYAAGLLPELPEELVTLLQSLKNDDVRVTVNWSAKGDEGELHLVWAG
jgi:hypothetical protein